MPEILTESFCERCGTRYTFESARQRERLKGVKVLSRGLKNFVLSDSTSIDEAMASARAETDRQVTTNQLDAFHQTFSFCLSCRQYTCSNCWNNVEARCLSCAPEVAAEGPGVAAAATVALTHAGSAGAAVVHATNGSNGHATRAGAVIAAGATFQVLSEPAAGGIVEPVEVVSPVELAAAAAEHQADGAASGAQFAAAEVEPAKAPGPAAPSEQEAKPAAPAASTSRKSADVGARTAAQTSALLRRFRPGQNIDAELEAYEQDRTSASAAAAPVPQKPGAVEAGPVAEPVAADARPTSEVLADLIGANAVVADTRSETDTIAAAPQPIAAEPGPIAARPEPAPEPMTAEAPAAPEQAEIPIAAAAEPPPPAAPVVRMTPSRTGFGRRAAVKPTAAPPSSIEDLVVQPTWQRVAPDVHPEQQPSAPSTPVSPSTPVPAPVPASASVPAAATIPAGASARDPESQAPQWPAQPEWPVSAAPKGLPFLNRPPVPESGVEGLWAASIREVVATPRIPGKPANAVQPCLSCGLSLSANARFCRRCGTSQV